MDKYFNLKTLVESGIESDLAKRIELCYNLLTPMRALDSKYDPEILTIHEAYNQSFIEGLKQIKSWDDYEEFLGEQLIAEERGRLKICAIMHPTRRKKEGKTEHSAAQIENVSNLWGTALIHLLQSETNFVKLKLKDMNDYTSMSVGDNANLQGLAGFTDSFYAGCEWAMQDNEKIADQLKATFEIKELDFKNFIDENGFDFIRYPIVHEARKNEFLSYLEVCTTLMSQEYGISKNRLGFGQNGLELCTTNSPAYYMPSTKAISLRLDMINAFYHEHFHALDHQVLLGIDVKQVQAMFGRSREVEYNLASDIKIIDDSKIDDSASKNVLLGFNRASQKMVATTDSDGKEVEFTPEEQEERRVKIVAMTTRFLTEIYTKLELDAAPFTPVIAAIMQDFKDVKKTTDFEDMIDKKLSPLVGEKFKESHKNYYVMMTQRIHHLYNKMNNKTLFYSFSLINDGGREKYFATKPEMLARSAESYFFNKYPKTNVTAPEWWETNSYLFYPQGEEKEQIVEIFQETVKAIRDNAAAFEEGLGKKNIKKVYRL